MAATIIAVIGVGALLFLAIRKLVRDSKAGKNTCGGSCSGCAQSCDHHGRPGESK